MGGPYCQQCKSKEMWERSVDHQCKYHTSWPESDPPNREARTFIALTEALFEHDSGFWGYECPLCDVTRAGSRTKARARSNLVSHLEDEHGY